jgi:hypothetical protein
MRYETWAIAKGLTGAAASFDAINTTRGKANGLLYAFGDNFSDSDAIIDLKIINGKPVIETPIQDPATMPFVTLAVEGTTVLSDEAPWPISLGLANDQSGLPPTRCRWVPVTPSSESGFFRIKITY